MTNSAVCSIRVAGRRGHYVLGTTIKCAQYLDSKHRTVLAYKQLHVWVIN